jgi:predicted transcriptional regulator
MLKPSEGSLDDKPADISSKPTTTTRMSLDLSPKTKAIVDRLAEQTGSTRAEIVRTAIALMKLIADAEERGETPALVDQEGKVTAKILNVVR